MRRPTSMRTPAALAAEAGPKVKKRVVMYPLYERLWHWTMPTLVLILLFSGWVIRYPSTFTMFKYEMAVHVHNWTAVLLILNAILGLFYYVTTGEIGQFKLDRKGLAGGMFKQALYYAFGIFRGATHPFHRQPNSRLNPLQRITYLMLLNVLFPLQVASGVLMIVAQDWPGQVQAIGGMRVLEEFHAVSAWLFLSFMIVHIYLTTTGETVGEHIGTMLRGYEELEVNATEAERTPERPFSVPIHNQAADAKTPPHGKPARALPEIEPILELELEPDDDDEFKG